MNRLFNNTLGPHALPAYRSKVEKLFIFIFLLLLLFVFNSCDGANKNGGKENAVADTTKRLAARDTTEPQDKPVSQSDSFFNALRKGRKIYVGDFDTMLKRRIIRVL